jgi:hypothetical protein
MEKETVLAKIQVTMRFSEATLAWFEEIQNTYLFSWDNVPGNDNERLLRYLKGNFDIVWAENVEIHKSKNGKTIHIFKDENFAEIEINEEKEKATLKINDGRTYDLKVKKENGKLNIYQKTDIWFAREGGTPFFSEFKKTYERTLISSSDPIIHSYFHELGVPNEKLPCVKVDESYSGSLIILAALVMYASMGTAYKILKGTSELPEIVKGLKELKDMLKNAFYRKASEKVNENLKLEARKYKHPQPPPQEPISVEFTIDARPLSSLTPSIMISHKIHLNVAISREAFTLENLGQNIVRDITIGIFKGHSQRDQWSIADSYKGTIDILSSQQTITKDIADFENSQRVSLDLSDNSPLHVDCWIQDSHGIYLFMFYLED